MSTKVYSRNLFASLILFSDYFNIQRDSRRILRVFLFRELRARFTLGPFKPSSQLIFLQFYSFFLNKSTIIFIQNLQLLIINFLIEKRGFILSFWSIFLSNYCRKFIKCLLFHICILIIDRNINWIFLVPSGIQTYTVLPSGLYCSSLTSSYCSSSQVHVHTFN